MLSYRAGVDARFIVLFLHDARGAVGGQLRPRAAAVQLIGAGARIVAGRRSDVEGLRIAPMRRIAARNARCSCSSRYSRARRRGCYPALLCAAVSTMTWNGLAFTAAAEIRPGPAGTAMSLQNTILAVGGALAPIAFGAVVEATSWTVGVRAARPGAAGRRARPAPAARRRARGSPSASGG